MKIKDLRKSPAYCFGDIEPGTVFSVKDIIYMAIEPIEENEFGVPLNAVNLETGELAHYLDDTAIQLVEAELCVR